MHRFARWQDGFVQGTTSVPCTLICERHQRALIEGMSMPDVDQDLSNTVAIVYSCACCSLSCQGSKNPTSASNVVPATGISKSISSMAPQSSQKPRILILGSGWGAMSFIKGLSKKDRCVAEAVLILQSLLQQRLFQLMFVSCAQSIVVFSSLCSCSTLCACCWQS